MTEIKPIGDVTIAIVEWNNPEIPSKVNVKNLSRVTKRGVMEL